MAKNPFLNKAYRWNRPKKQNNLESVTQLRIIHYLKALGAVIGKTKTMGVKRGKTYCFDPYTFLGFPDLTFFYKDKLYFCEVKSPKGTQSIHQRAFQSECRKANIPYILARTLEDISDIVK